MQKHTKCKNYFNLYVFKYNYINIKTNKLSFQSDSLAILMHLKTSSLYLRFICSNNWSCQQKK